LIESDAYEVAVITGFAGVGVAVAVEDGVEVVVGFGVFVTCGFGDVVFAGVVGFGVDDLVGDAVADGVVVADGVAVAEAVAVFVAEVEADALAEASYARTSEITT
jgi:hypothetical protein